MHIDAWMQCCRPTEHPALSLFISRGTLSDSPELPITGPPMKAPAALKSVLSLPFTSWLLVWTVVWKGQQNVQKREDLDIDGDPHSLHPAAELMRLSPPRSLAGVQAALSYRIKLSCTALSRFI